MSIDSIYAMLARPVRAVSERRRIVEQVKSNSAINPDSHEAPQSQLPPQMAHKALLKQPAVTMQERRARQRHLSEKKTNGNRLRRMDADKRFSTRGETTSQHIDIEV